METTHDGVARSLEHFHTTDEIDAIIGKFTEQYRCYLSESQRSTLVLCLHSQLNESVRTFARELGMAVGETIKRQAEAAL